MASTVGEHLSWGVIGVLAVSAAVAPGACAPQDGPGDSEASADVVADLLADVGPSVVIPTAEAMVVDAGALVDAVVAWSDAEASDGDAATARTDAQAAWRQAMDTWQQAELMQLGPAGSSLSVVGGRDLRDELYSWPTVNPCRVDQEVAEQGYDAADFFETNLVNAYGLDALEYLLFVEDADNACPGQAPPNSDGAWEALDDVDAARAAYAVAVATRVEETAIALADAWAADDGDFAGAVAEAGSADPYESTEQALQAVYDAAFYLYNETKDAKIGTPAGLAECGDVTCPDRVESLWAEASLAHIAANLEGFRTVFTGGEATGLDDLLAASGHEDLSNQVLQALTTAEDALAAVPTPLSTAVDEHPDEVVALYDAVKAVGDLLKNDVSAALLLQVPQEAAGDND